MQESACTVMTVVVHPSKGCSAVTMSTCIVTVLMLWATHVQVLAVVGSNIYGAGEGSAAGRCTHCEPEGPLIGYHRVCRFVTFL